MGAGVAALLATVVAVLSLRVWEWRPGVPPSLVGDSPLVLTQLDDILVNGWFWSNDAVGFPLGQNASFFPELNVVHVLGVKALGLLGGDAATVGSALLLPRVPARRRHDLPPRPQRTARATGSRRRRGALRRRALPRRALRAPLARVVLDPPARRCGWCSRWRGVARPSTPGPATGRRRAGAHAARPHPRRAQRGVLRRVHPHPPRRRPRAARGRRRDRRDGGEAGWSSMAWLGAVAALPLLAAKVGMSGTPLTGPRPATRIAPGVRAVRRTDHRPRPAVGGPPARAARRPHARPTRPPGRPVTETLALGSSALCGAPPCCSSGLRVLATGRPAPARLRLWAALLARRRRLLHGRGPRERRRAARHPPAAHLVAPLPRHPAARAAGGRATGSAATASRSSGGGLPAAGPRGRRPRPDQPGSARPTTTTSRARLDGIRCLHRAPWQMRPQPGCGVLQLPGHEVPRGLPASRATTPTPSSCSTSRPPARAGATAA